MKDAIESAGVPHTEVDLIVVDGVPVDFSHLLRGGERVAVYPMFERLDGCGACTGAHSFALMKRLVDGLG